MGEGRKLCFQLKIYVIFFNSFCVFLLEHIDVLGMFLLLPAIKNKTIIGNKTEDRQYQSHPPVERGLQTRGNFSIQINLQDSSVSGNSKL